MQNSLINLFSKTKKSNSLGFEYVKLTRDSNGLPFKEEKLLEYAKKCHYIVRIMRKINGEICLYNYDVPYVNLTNFIENLDGTIIEIEKVFPKDLA